MSVANGNLVTLRHCCVANKNSRGDRFCNRATFNLDRTTSRNFFRWGCSKESVSVPPLISVFGELEVMFGSLMGGDGGRFIDLLLGYLYFFYYFECVYVPLRVKRSGMTFML